jgi:hypothetical protein
MIGEAIYIRVSDRNVEMCRPRVGATNPLFSLWRAFWRPTAPASRTKSRRTAEESRTSNCVATKHNDYSIFWFILKRVIVKQETERSATNKMKRFLFSHEDSVLSLSKNCPHYKRLMDVLQRNKNRYQILQQCRYSNWGGTQGKYLYSCTSQV